MKTVRLEVPEQDGWVDLYDPGDWTHRKFRAWVKKSEELKTATDSPAAEEWLREVISAWHIVDGDTGAVLTDPQKDDLAALKLTTTKAITEKAVALIRDAAPFRST
jgi:hypothetical protein